MTSKIIAVAVVIIVIGGGIYYYVHSKSAAAPAATNTQQQPAATTPQVAGQDVTVGTGATATPNSSVEVLYVGMLQDGTVFDSSANNGNKPLPFTLGQPGIIPGFQIGINGMKEGGKRRISIPPELGYGTQDVKDATGKVIIPANSTLVFDVQLVKVTAAKAPVVAPAGTPAKTQ